MGKKNKANVLGRALIKNRFGHTSRQKLNNDSMLHTTQIQDGYDWGRLNLQSVTEESSFNEFLRTAEIAGTEFKAEKLNIAFIHQKTNVGILTGMEKCNMQKKHFDKKDLLKIPRRPKWSIKTKAEDLQAAENESFLEWRRNLAMLQENEDLLMTPYEKNLEFWRQLWRVVERSDVIIQIVDSRNPLQFMSEDLEKYVKEVDNNKINVILINKADFLTAEQRIVWAKYFDTLGKKVAFFSATMAAEENKSMAADKLNNSDDEYDSDFSENLKKSEMRKKDFQSAANELVRSIDRTEKQLNIIESKLGLTTIENCNDPRILSRVELIEFFKSIHTGKKKTNDISTIGLVGYPNVGKSSTINSLIIEKKVSVSATPGKTKHFQTLYLDSDIMLCDCPGLVMPSFVLTKADMILNGILPIDHLRDHVPPINLVCSEIPRHILEDKYGIVIAKPIEGEDPNRSPYSEELLLAYGYNRGFMTANGQPDQSRSARYILKDYVNGKLLYCHAPPNHDQEEYHKFEARTKKEINEKCLPESQKRAMRINKYETSNDVDDKFFQLNSKTVYVKGKSNFPHIRLPQSNNTDSQIEGSSITGSMQSINGVKFTEKPWRNMKKEKREKLRNKYAYLDQH